MPKPKSKTKKVVKNTPKVKVNPLEVVLLVLVIGLTAFSGYLLANQKSFEEKKRLQAFETLLDSDIKDMLYAYEDGAEYWSTETGLTADNNDLYVKFKYLQYEDDEKLIPSYTNTGVIYYPCSNKDGKVIGQDDSHPCGKHIDIDDNKKAIDPELNSKIKGYAQQLKQVQTAMNAILDNGYLYDDGGARYFDFDLLTEEQRNTFESLSAEQFKAYDEYYRLLDQIWDYL